MTTQTTVLVIWHAALFPSYRKPFWYLQKEKGWDVHLLASSWWSKTLPQKTYFQIEPNEPITTHAYHSLFNFHGALHVHPTLPYIFSSVKPDIVLAIEEPFSVMGWLATYWCKRNVPPIPIVLYSHQNITKKYPFPFHQLESYVLKHADRILACDDSVGETLVAKGYQRPWDTVPLSVDLDKFTYHSPRETGECFTVGYVGRLADEKGIDTLLWAIEDLDDAVRLHLIGDGPARYRLENMAQELGITNQVKFIGPLNHSDLVQHYHQLDALVLPSKTTTQWKEQFGRVIIEAMACGVPVIGSDSGAIPGVIGDAGMTFSEGNATMLSEKIWQLQQDMALRNQLSFQGRIQVEQRYSHSRVAERLHRHLREVLDLARRA